MNHDGGKKEAGFPLNRKKQKRTTTLFIGALLLAGMMHLVDRLLVNWLLRSGTADNSMYLAACSTALFVLNLAIYLYLLVGWTQSLKRRLIPSRARTDMILAAAFMLFILINRAIKYRVSDSSELLDHICWYVYYVPVAMIPTLFLLTCLSMGPDRPRRAVLRRIIWIVSVTLALAVVTNDFHYWMFIPRGGRQGGNWGSYSNGPLWYIYYGYIFLVFFLGFVLLIRMDRRKNNGLRTLPAVLLVLLIPVPGQVETVVRSMGWMLFTPYMFPETYCFAVVGIFETCVRSRLIPSNENYEGFFSHMNLAADITDPALVPVYATAKPIPAAEAQRRAALKEPLLLDQDTRLYGKTIETGCAFWTGDESTLRRLNEELADAAEVLETENELLQYENEQKEARARVDARNRVYTKAAAEVYGTQKKIAALLEGMAPGAPDYREKLARLLALNAYVKRKTNFVLLASERDSVSAEELFLALEESARFLALCGVNASVERKADRAFTHREAAALYDSFEALAEALIGRTSDLMISLTNSTLRLMAECGPLNALPDTPGRVTAEEDGGQLYFTVTAKKGGAA